MNFERMNSKEHKHYEEAMAIYEASFPPFEKRSEEDQLAAMEDPNFYATVVKDEDKVVGILFYWLFDNTAYIEHLAIAERLRGQNYGTKILDTFCPTQEKVLLEIDPPVDDVSIKRLGFYEGRKFRMQPFKHIHPPFKKACGDYELKVMSYNREMSEEEFKAYQDFLFDTIMRYSEK